MAKRRVRKDLARYERWYPLFEEELALFAKPRRENHINRAHRLSKFLTEMGLHGHAGMVAHPAPMGLGKAGKEIPATKNAGINSSEIRPRKIRISFQRRSTRLRHWPSRNWCLTT